jgi:hypothetical protein
MRLAILAGLTLLSGSLSATAQSAKPVQSQPTQSRPTLVLNFPAVSSCPIDAGVRQGVGSQLLAVDKDGSPVKRSAARLHLFLNKTRRPERVMQIVNATVTVHGLNGRDRILPLRSDSAEISRTLTVRITPEDDMTLSGDILLPGFTSTRMVDLESVTLADGEVWTLDGNGTCHMAPDPIMRVSAR